MKLMIGDFEVDIKAKVPQRNARNNLLDTMYFLNNLSIAFGEASAKYKIDGYPALAKEFNEASHQIYDTLEKIGAYKEI